MRFSVKPGKVKLLFHLYLHELEWVLLELDLQVRLLLLLVVFDAHAFHQIVNRRLEVCHAAIPKQSAHARLAVFEK